jgi:hypothetical protein
MTKSTLNALLAGGGALATWLVVTPNPATPPSSTLAPAARTTTAREVTVDDLSLQEARLREHLGSVPLRPSARNPFRFGKPGTSEPAAQPAAAPGISTPAPPPAAPQPSLSLSGIAGAAANGKRRAIITGDGQLYVVTEGEMVAGRYRVVTVDSDAVTLRDEAGTELRLILK